MPNVAEFRKIIFNLTGDTTPEEIDMNSNFFANYIVISGRNSGILTFAGEPLGGSDGVFDEIGTLDLSTKHTLVVKDLPLNKLQITADTIGTFTISVYPYDDSYMSY